MAGLRVWQAALRKARGGSALPSLPSTSLTRRVQKAMGAGWRGQGAVCPVADPCFLCFSPALSFSAAGCSSRSRRRRHRLWRTVFLRPARAPDSSPKEGGKKEKLMTSLGVDVVALYVPPARLSSAASTDAAGRSLRDFFFLPGTSREHVFA